MAITGTECKHTKNILVNYHHEHSATPEHKTFAVIHCSECKAILTVVYIPPKKVD